jgi:hypothetical protein
MVKESLANERCPLAACNVKLKRSDDWHFIEPHRFWHRHLR